MLWSIKINSELYYCCLLCYLLVRIYLATADDNGRRFGYHCPQRASDYINIREVDRNISWEIAVMLAKVVVVGVCRIMAQGARDLTNYSIL